jgi:hypothetical protein
VIHRGGEKRLALIRFSLSSYVKVRSIRHDAALHQRASHDLTPYLNTALAVALCCESPSRKAEWHRRREDYLMLFSQENENRADLAYRFRCGRGRQPPVLPFQARGCLAGAGPA